MRTWHKLYKQVSPSFAQLPLVTRAIAWEILRLADEQGQICLGHRSPVDAIAFMVGATKGDRRMLRRAIDELAADGYLHVTDGHLAIRNFGKFQDKKRRRAGTPPAALPVAKRPRRGHGVATKGRRAGHEKEPKPPKSLNTGPVEENKNKKRKEFSPASQDIPDSALAEVRRLESNLGSEFCSKLRSACALSRRTGTMADSVWTLTLQKLSKHDAAAVREAGEKFIERYADGDKDERYLLGMVRRHSTGSTAKRGGYARPASAAEFRSDGTDPEQFFAQLGAA